MTATLLDDAFAHHVWATERLIDTCAALTPEQLRTPAPGTYGPILDTLRPPRQHGRLVPHVLPRLDEPGRRGRGRDAGRHALRDRDERGGVDASCWPPVPTPEEDIVEHGEGWDFHSPLGFRLAQVVHHGTDHRSQICTALTSLGVEPPAIDLWAYGDATKRSRGVEL